MVLATEPAHELAEPNRNQVWVRTYNATYLRFKGDESRRKAAISYQATKCALYAESLGLSPLWRYEEPGSVSGLRMIQFRDEGQLLTKHIIGLRIDHLILYRLSVLGKSIPNVIAFLQMCDQLGTKVHTVVGGVVPSHDQLQLAFDSDFPGTFSLHFAG